MTETIDDLDYDQIASSERAEHGWADDGSLLVGGVHDA
jgi:hypothetical protein